MEVRGLGHDPGIGSHPVRYRCRAAGARRLLVGHGANDQVSFQADSHRVQDLGREDHRREAALMSDAPRPYTRPSRISA